MGVTLSGTTSSQIHPDIASGAMQLTVHVPTMGGLAYVELRGDVMIAGEGVRDATVHVDAEGHARERHARHQPVQLRDGR